MRSWEAGVTDRLWSLEDVVGIVDEWEAARRNKKMGDRKALLEAFERDLAALLSQLDATVGMNDPLWSHADNLRRRAWHLRTGDKRIKHLHRKLDDMHSLLIRQSTERQKCLDELRSIENSN